MSNTSELLAEFIGTFILLIAILLTGYPLYIAAAFLAAITIAGAVSGGHINPVVSVVMYLKGDLAPAKLPLYIVAQLCGALAAYGVYRITQDRK
jgi:aquaporin Z